MKKNYFLLLLLFAAFLGYSQIESTTYRGAFAPAPTPMWTNGWTNYDPQNTVYPATTVDITANITVDTQWTANNTYALKGQIYVTNGATLTIEAGTVIRADLGTVGAALLIARGAKINAVGTQNNPIVFTSNYPVGQRTKGDWGGVILLGNASFNINNGVNSIEGVAATPLSSYGGGTTPNDDDNSGVMKYVRIEFGGYVYAQNQEINGLTFGAVGRGTTIDYIQSSFTNDDSFEWFGGTVNCKHLVAFRGLDDDFDTDNGFSGNVQFCLGVRDPQIADDPLISTSEGFESDNNATSTAVAPYTSAVFTNCTLIGPSYRVNAMTNGGTLASGYRRVARIRRNSQLKVYNSVFLDFPQGLFVDGTTTEANANFGAATAGGGTMRWRNNIMAGIVSAPLTVASTTAANATALANWYSLNTNTTVATNAGLLTLPYATSNDALVYTGLDYRPAVNSIALTGADFSDAALGVNALENIVGVESAIYPNPSSNEFKIKFLSYSTDQILLFVTDIAGRAIENRKFDYNTIENIVFGSGYNTGIYLVQLKQGDFSKTYKIIKN